MDPKNFVVILLAFCTTLLLGFGISTVFGASGIDICKEAFCYIIRDYIQFYRTIFFTFGCMLTVIAIFGFIGLVLRNKKILLFYARLLVLVLVGVLLILCAGIWAKGPVQLRASLISAIQKYPDSCRIIASVDSLQTQFKCCGVDRPEDWSTIFNKTYLEPPISCCNTNMIDGTQNDNSQCLTTYSRGCLCPLRQTFWRFFNVVVLLSSVIALKSTVAIICTYKIIDTEDSVPSHVLSQQNLLSASATAPLNIAYHHSDLLRKDTSSTAV